MFLEVKVHCYCKIIHIPFFLLNIELFTYLNYHKCFIVCFYIKIQSFSDLSSIDTG